MRLIVLAATFVAAASLSACAPVKPYRTNISSCEVIAGGARDARPRCADHSIEDHGKFTTAFVELTDMGLFHRRAQLDAALKLVAARPNEPVQVLVFVHGWKHNARYDDPHLGDFVGSVMPTMAGLRPEAKTVGIYVGWRGTPLTVLKSTTFYDRKSAADHVARGSLRELLAHLRAIKQQNGDRMTVTLVGHSFGGLILFNAISGAIMDAITQSNYAAPGTEAVAPALFDAAVLLNPAFEAVRFEPLFQAGKERTSGVPTREWPASQRPILISITSQADSATRVWFPLGRVVNSLFQSETTIDQDEAGSGQETRVEKLTNTHTMGHVPRYRTHQLSMDSNRIACVATDNRVTGAANRFPLWTMLADKQVIGNHDDIYDPHLWEFIASLANRPKPGQAICADAPKPN